MTVRKLNPRKHLRVIEDSEDEEIESRHSSPAKRTKDELQSALPKSRILTPTTSEDEEAQGISIRGPWNPLSHVEIPPITCPKSSYAGSGSSVIEFSEQDALQDLLRSWKTHQKSPVHNTESDVQDYIEFHVEDFAVYREEATRYLGRDRPPVVEYELCSLETLRSKRGLKMLLLDAVLSFRGTKRHIRRVPFDIVSIEGYDSLDIASVTGVFLQTQWCKPKNIWLRLGKPSREYARYHDEFLWCADFGKHVVDYMSRTELVSLSHFRSRFFEWAMEEHGSKPQFLNWASKLRSTDFRTAFNRHVQWLWSEGSNEWIDSKQAIRSHPIWCEADPETKFLTSIPQQSSHASIKKTIVTPYVYECFKHMYFAQEMESRDISDLPMQTAYERRKEELGFPRSTENPRCNIQPTEPLHDKISVGDVIGVPRDAETKWLSKSSVWYFYVNRIQEDDEGPYYQGIWLYEPQDTTMANMAYPYKNELFMSDNCNCDDFTIRPEDIITRAQVAWTPDKIPASTHFVRQTYITCDQSFRTLRKDDFACNCHKPPFNEYARVHQDYAVFDTILILTKRRGEEILEPCIIEEFLPLQESVRVRQLQRAGRDFSCVEARPNDLVWTSNLVDVKAARVVRKCNIRFLIKHASCTGPACRECEAKARSLYHRNGQADCFLISKRLVEVGGKVFAVDLLHAISTPMDLGQDFANESSRRLPAMSLFCGGGNFDRGLVEANAIETKWAVEWDAHAAHTYRANLDDTDETSIFLGSVDEHLRRALAGQLSTTVPAIGKVDVILAGSPCQGFSSLQPDRLSVKSLTNASKIATVASYIDLWRPIYAVLENVPEMARQVGHGGQENVFSQLLCCLIGMGYQVQQLLMDAWSYGEAQSRSRLFIIVTAPGLPLLKHPNMTHAHPGDMHGKSLGKAPNGEPFGVRFYTPTIYPFVSAREATRDLPDIGDGHTQACISMPDHRAGLVIKPMVQQFIRTIPKRPRGQGLVDVLANSEDLPRILRDWILRQSNLRLSENSKSWRRLEPRKLFRTITTTLSPSDGKAGYGVHWEQDRVLTIMEARRAQGFLDHEVVLGDIAVQWKIIGNSVSRAVALALGISLRDAGLTISGHGPARVSRPPREASPLVIIGAPQERIATALPTPCSPGLQLRVEADRFQTSILSKSHEHHETAFRGFDDLQPSSPVTFRRSPPRVQQHHHSLSALAIRPSQTPARQLPRLKTTSIIELDDNGCVIEGDPSASTVSSPDTPGFEIHQDTAASAYPVRSSDNIAGAGDDPRLKKQQLENKKERTMPAKKAERGEQEHHGIHDDEDDDVVFVSSRTVMK